MNKAIFLDKDGTIVDNSNYPKIIPTDKLLESKILDGLMYIQKKGYKIYIVSNQPWIAKNKLSTFEVEKIFTKIINKLLSKGITIHDYFYCPHQTSDNCECKKPKNGLILNAAKKYKINLKKSYMIGDMEQDIIAGKISEMKTILVLTGLGKKFKDKTLSDHIINNLNEIENII